jgi:hypothetical protein
MSVMQIIATASNVEESILEQLRIHTRMKGLDLLKTMSYLGYMESEVQRAMSNLLSSGRIELTTDRNLQYKAA